MPLQRPSTRCIPGKKADLIVLAEMISSGANSAQYFEGNLMLDWAYAVF
jgi:hypothetical protein